MSEDVAEKPDVEIDAFWIQHFVSHPSVVNDSGVTCVSHAKQKACPSPFVGDVPRADVGVEPVIGVNIEVLVSEPDSFCATGIISSVQRYLHVRSRFAVSGVARPRPLDLRSGFTRSLAVDLNIILSYLHAHIHYVNCAQSRDVITK